ncbi:MAG: hypothetical protein IKB70_10265 [Bacilli bacterium]|nr:hypothetical protein [Bacilli bacterium]
MIKLGTKKELYKINHLPTKVKEYITEDVSALDCFYGNDRNIDVDMGGFVVICEADEEISIENFTENLEKAEYIQEIFPYCKALYISGTERNIIIYRKKK